MSDKIPWEVGKEYALQIGWKARIYATDGYGFSIIHGAYFHENQKIWIPICWDTRGIATKEKALFGNNFDLLPPALPRIKGECWLVVTSSGVMGAFESKSAAVNRANNYYRVAIIHVPYDVAEGEGLEP